MTIFITIGAIFLITGLVSMMRRILPFPVCPICIGVSSVWIGLLAGWFIGFAVDLRIPAILMGGSVVGIAYQGEKRLPATRSPLLWKSLFIPLGFALVFMIVDEQWGGVITTLIILVLLALWFFLPQRTSTVRATALEEKMKNCC